MSRSRIWGRPGVLVQPHETVVLVELGARFTEVSVVSWGRVSYSASFAVAGDEISRDIKLALATAASAKEAVEARIKDIVDLIKEKLAASGPFPHLDWVSVSGSGPFWEKENLARIASTRAFPGVTVRIEGNIPFPIGDNRPCGRRYWQNGWGFDRPMPL